jgi:hypothetical protein
MNVGERSDCRLNGKKVEIAVKHIVSGSTPESLEEYRQFVEVEKVHKERYRGSKI